MSEKNGGESRSPCVGLDSSLLEVVGVGLITCAEAGLVRQVHTIFVRSAQQVVHELQVQEEVEGVRQEVREAKKGRARSKRVGHFMNTCGCHG